MKSQRLFAEEGEKLHPTLPQRDKTQHHQSKHTHTGNTFFQQDFGRQNLLYKIPTFFGTQNLLPSCKIQDFGRQNFPKSRILVAKICFFFCKQNLLITSEIQYFGRQNCLPKKICLPFGTSKISYEYFTLSRREGASSHVHAAFLRYFGLFHSFAVMSESRLAREKFYR